MLHAHRAHGHFRRRRATGPSSHTFPRKCPQDVPPHKLPRAEKAAERVDLTGLVRRARDMGLRASPDALCAAQEIDVAHRAAAQLTLGLSAAPTASAAPAALAGAVHVVSLPELPPASRLALCSGPVAAARVAPEPKFQRIGKGQPRVSREDRATLRRMAAELAAEGPSRWKTICASDIGQRLGFTTKQLRDVVKQKAQEPPSSAQWSDTLQSTLVEEVAARGRVWAVIRREGADGAFSAFRPEDLRRRYDEDTSVARMPVCKQYAVGGQRVRGVTLVKGGRYQVCFRGKYVGLCETLVEAAAKWDEEARSAGFDESRLNAVPQDAAAAAAGGPVRQHAKYSMSEDGTTISLFQGHSLSPAAFLAAAEALCKQARNHSACTWGALAHHLGMGDLIGKSAAVHSCFASLLGVDMKTTMWDVYRSGDGEAMPAATAAAAAAGAEPAAASESQDEAGAYN